MDYYQVLGVDKSASEDDIRRAYRRLARKYHPDVNGEPGAEDMFKQINEANEVLSDPSTRSRYDRFHEQFGDSWRQVPEDYEPGTGRPFGGADGGVYYEGNGFEGVDINDLLGGLFGGGGRGGFGGRFGAQPMDVPGADIEAPIELSVEDAYGGGRRTLSMRTASGIESIDVNIPAGVTTGQRIRVAGKGMPGIGEGPSGDLYLVVTLAPHSRFRVSGRDLTVELPLAPWEAALGTEVSIETPGGTPRLKVPAGSSSGRKLRLRGRGLPNPKGSAGDLYAEVKIVTPTELTDEERELWERLAAISGLAPDRPGDRVGAAA